MKKIALLGEFDPGRETHIATVNAIDHSAKNLGVNVHVEWIPSSGMDILSLCRHNGLWIAPGCKYADQDKIIQAIHFTRKNAIPCIGTCAGFQHMILEYARNELGIHDAQSEEYAPESSRIFISRSSCSLRGMTMPVCLAEGSIARKLYGKDKAMERYYCTLGVNAECRGILLSGKMKVSGVDAEGEIRIIEWPGHPFFLGTLYVPQVLSSYEKPHPLISGFLREL